MARALSGRARYRSVTAVGERAGRVLDALGLAEARLPDRWPGTIDDLAARRVLRVRR